MRNLTIGDLVEFILLNKSNKTFLGYTIPEIALKVKIAADAGTLYYSTNEHGIINGMILATKHEDTKVLFVDENLAMCKDTLRKFAKRAKQEFADYKLEWQKHGIHKSHNTEKVYAKLS